MSCQESAIEDVQAPAQQVWDTFLGLRPKLYLTGRTPHGECDPRVHKTRRLWTTEELRAFDCVVERRTESLLDLQQRVHERWERTATRIQAHARGMVSRVRVQRIRQMLEDQARQAQAARELAALCRRQHLAACQIQRLYRRHCEHLHFLYRCRVRMLRAVGLFIFRRRRHQAARVVQRVFRRYRRRQRLRHALRVLMKMLQMSRQKETLEKAAMTFAFARAERRRHEEQAKWVQRPQMMTNARRVQARRIEVKEVGAAALPALQRDTQKRMGSVVIRPTEQSAWMLPTL